MKHENRVITQQQYFFFKVLDGILISRDFSNWKEISYIKFGGKIQIDIVDSFGSWFNSFSRFFKEFSIKKLAYFSYIVKVD